jgi:cysteine-rich repeat protein
MRTIKLCALSVAVLCVPWLGAGCVDAPAAAPVEEGLTLDLADDSVQGTFGFEGKVVEFHAWTRDDGKRAAVDLEIDGKLLTIELDFESQHLVEDAHGETFELGDRAVLLALRDAVAEKMPEVIDTLHGKLLVKAADRYAEVPVGRSLARREVGFSLDVFPRYKTTGGCGGDGVTCLSGTSGSSYAVFSSGSTCNAEPVSYGDSVCRGRCGMGCNWFDNDYTWDCLDHDVCLDHQNDCADEFTDAADDWAATMAPLCWSGSSRSKPPEVQLPQICGDGQKSPSEACDDGNTVNGDGCESNCTVTPETPSIDHLVINEIDYDQPGTDGAEFIELYNGTPAAVSLDGLALVLVNGATSAEYKRVLLSGSLGAGGYAVVCPQGPSAGSCASGVSPAAGATVFSFVNASNNIQNGSADGVALVNLTTQAVVDAVCYEGGITAGTINGLGTVDLVEGTASAVVDNDMTAGQSMSRSPNGADVGDASVDWAARPSTPGAPNP